MNTVELLRVCSAKLGIGPAQTMNVAERLYTQGFISYPRTETTQYPTNYKFEPVVSMYTNTAGFGEAARECLAGGCNPRKGDDKGDHPPITPQRLASESEIGGEAYRVYDYIVNHFLASLMKDYKTGLFFIEVRI